MEPNPDPFLRYAAQPDNGQLPLDAQDLETIEKALNDPSSALLSDRILMVMQNILKSMDKKEVAAIFGDLRSITWFAMSQRALQERGLGDTPQPQNRTPFQKMKAFVDAINDVSTVVWAPVSLMNKYGVSRLASIAASCGLGLHEKSLQEFFKSALGTVAIGRFELDAMQKVLSLAISTNKGLLSPDFIRSTLEVGRISAQTLGYNQTSYLLGIVSASIGAWQVWRTIK
jgi:hypothetical protein